MINSCSTLCNRLCESVFIVGTIVLLVGVLVRLLLLAQYDPNALLKANEMLWAALEATPLAL